MMLDWEDDKVYSCPVFPLMHYGFRMIMVGRVVTVDCNFFRHGWMDGLEEGRERERGREYVYNISWV